MNAVKRRLTFPFALATSLLIINACGDDDARPITLPETPPINTTDQLDQIGLSSEGNLAWTYQWSASNTEIQIENGNNPVAFFKIPAGSTVQETEITLKVSYKNKSAENTKTITVPVLTDERAYGLGKKLESKFASNRDYNWYVDQYNTGTHSLTNCGPAAVTMAIKWANPDFEGTPEDARKAYRSQGGWWFTDDILHYLEDNHVNNYVTSLGTFNTVQDRIDDGDIVILCLDMYYVSYMSSNPSYRFNKFYNTKNTGWGHFIVVKGYRQVDGKLFYEVYDPYSLNERYTDGALKGENRYYRSADLDKATQVWWDYAIVITGDDNNGSRHKVNIDQIRHMPGGVLP